MSKIKVREDYDYVAGHLRYGHREGILDLSDEDLEDFKKDPEKFLKETGARCDLKFTLDDHELDDYGKSTISYEEITTNDNNDIDADINDKALIKSLAVIGYANYHKGISYKELDELNNDEIEKLINEFNDWIKNFKWENEGVD